MFHIDQEGERDGERKGSERERNLKQGFFFSLLRGQRMHNPTNYGCRFMQYVMQRAKHSTD